MPALCCNALGGARNGGKEGGKALNAMGWQGDGRLGCVNDPTKDKFPCCPSAVALAELFLGSGFVAVNAVTRLKGAEDSIKGVEELAFDLTAAGGVALDNRNEVVDIDIRVGCRSASVLSSKGPLMVRSRH